MEARLSWMSKQKWEQQQRNVYEFSAVYIFTGRFGSVLVVTVRNVACLMALYQLIRVPHLPYQLNLLVIARWRVVSPWHRRLCTDTDAPGHMQYWWFGGQIIMFAITWIYQPRRLPTTTVVTNIVSVGYGGGQVDWECYNSDDMELFLGCRRCVSKIRPCTVCVLYDHIKLWLHFMELDTICAGHIASHIIRSIWFLRIVFSEVFRTMLHSPG